MNTSALALLAVTVTAVAVAAPPKDFARRAEAARADIGAPGMAIAIVENDQVVLAQGFGLRSLGKPDKVDHAHYYIRDGIVIIPKNGIIPHGMVI